MKEDLYYQDKSTLGILIIKNAITYLLEKIYLQNAKKGAKNYISNSENFNNIVLSKNIVVKLHLLV